MAQYPIPSMRQGDHGRGDTVAEEIRAEAPPGTDAMQAVIERCLAGDEAAMREVVEEFQGSVYGLCFRMLGHAQDAEDAAQESFVRAFRSLRGYDRSRAFRPWLLAIAGNRCRTMLAARRGNRQAQPLLMDVADDAPPESGARQLAEELELALVSLREEYRQAFLLLHQQQLSYAEIAEQLECPVGTVKTWVHRARQELVRALRERGVVQESKNEL